MKRLMLALGLAFAAATGLHADTITQWNFQDGVGGTNTPNIGTGTISHLGGVTHTGFNSGSGSSDPVQPGSAHQTTTYPAQSTASGTAGIQFAVNTTGFQNVICKFDLRTSNTSSRWYQIKYTTDGINFVDLGTPVRLERFDTSDPPNEIGVGDFFSNQRTVDFTGVPAGNNNPNFAFQVVSVFSPVAFTEFVSSTNYLENVAYEAARNRGPGLGTQSAYAGGTWRFDMVTIEGTVLSVAAPSLVNARPYHNSFAGLDKVDSSVSLIQRGANLQTVELENIISSSQGINGVVLDFDNLENLNDITLEYKWSPENVFADPIGTWGNAIAPESSTLQSNAGQAGSDRVLLTWANGAIANRYLCIRVIYNGNTIAELYLGHLRGEMTGASGGKFTILVGDILAVRQELTFPKDATGRNDVDKSGTILVQDILDTRSNLAKELTQLTVPAN
ncbi:MAG TPA: hypothetical protein DCF63_13070 [Planctomycetaceae bacterium]|nr:hypothetical protein [Planctomycetaceae bacterium]